MKQHLIPPTIPGSHPIKTITAAEFREQWANQQSGKKTIAPSSVAKKGNGGKREDLDGRYFRSSWEANMARYLNYCIRRKRDVSLLGCEGIPVKWEYEPQEFKLFRADKNQSEYKTGARFYKPDFRLYFANGDIVWLEVKGWMDALSKTKLERFGRCYPDERIIIVDKKGMSKIAIFSEMIPCWEK